MGYMTKQDLFTVTEVAKNKIIERLVTKYDVQVACDSVRDKILSKMQEMHLDNQAMFRQLNAQNDQAWRKIDALERRVKELQAETKAMHRLLGGSTEELEEFQAAGLSSFPVK